MSIQKYIIKASFTIREALVALNKLSKDTLALFVVDNDDCVVGTVTDGDIRRKLINAGSLENLITSAMHKEFVFIEENNIDVRKIREYKSRGITLLPCLDRDGKILNIYDLNKIESLLPIDAVLMAGGKGERLRPLTDKTPKPLLYVGDKAIIDYNIDRLINFGIKHISVTVNYLCEQIENHFISDRKGVSIKCVKEPKYLGTIGSVKFVSSFFNDTVLVMNSDLFTNINYEDFYLHFIDNEADVSVAAIPYSVSVPYGIFELNGHDIYGVKEKPTYNYYANAGVYLIKRHLLDLIPDDIFYDATDFIEMLIQKKMKVIRFPVTGYWIDIGKPEDYKRAQELVKHL